MLTQKRERITVHRYMKMGDREGWLARIQYGIPMGRWASTWDAGTRMVCGVDPWRIDWFIEGLWESLVLEEKNDDKSV